MWRISAAAPLGEFVDPDALPPPRAASGEPETGGWVVSSFDLKHGADVHEDFDTVPDELFDQLFPEPSRKPSDAG
ncbi:MAG: hypothetical protein H7Y61_16295 [Rhizobiales bacterium]|nr:hypothetical protein [Rhizobacter sp.]